MTPMQRTIRWSVIIGIILLLAYYFRSILTPYLVGIALAYFLDPIADWFERHGFKRIIAVTIITLVAIAIIALIILIALPLAFQQFVQLIQGFPSFFDSVNNYVVARFPQISEIEADVVHRISNSTDQIISAISNWVLSSTASIFSWVGAFVIVPTVAFYMLWDWDRVSAVVESWVPRENLNTYRYLAGQIDNTLSGFVRGQGTVCFVMAIYYATVLTITGLNFGFVIGLIAGITTAIPMIGGLFGGVLVIGVGLFQFVLGDGNWAHYILVLVVYFAGQAFEGNIFTPRMVGGSVGLHPVWVLFALSAGAFIAGFAGMLIAVPVAAVIGVVGRYLMNIYKHGPLYLGDEYDKKAASEYKKLKTRPEDA